MFSVFERYFKENDNFPFFLFLYINLRNTSLESLCDLYLYKNTFDLFLDCRKKVSLQVRRTMLIFVQLIICMPFYVFLKSAAQVKKIQSEQSFLSTWGVHFTFCHFFFIKVTPFENFITFPAFCPLFIRNFLFFFKKFIPTQGDLFYFTEASEKKLKQF